MSSIEDKIPEGWVETTLVELTKKIGSGATPRGGSDSYKEQGISLIRSQNILDFDFSYNGLAFIDETQARKLSNVTLEQKDVLINITGDSVARVCMVPSRVLPARVNQHVAIIRANTQKIDNHFLLYYLLDPNFKRFLLQIASNGATRNALTKSDLESLLIKTPIDLKEQKAIAQVLTAFDDKIENLRAQNKTLETLAQTIFAAWFLPSRQAGGKYQVDDELPEGWRVGKLGEEFDISIGRTPPRKETQWFSDTPTGKKWISIRDIGNCGVYIENTAEYLTDEAIEKFNIPVIPKNTTILSFKMTVGKLTITTEDMLSNEAIAHLKLKDGTYLTSEYIYLHLQNLDFNSLGSTSSIVTAINSTIIKNLDFIIPDKEALKKIELIINSLFKKIKNNTEQIQSLTQTRDTLLPKLMRGELRIKEYMK